MCKNVLFKNQVGMTNLHQIMMKIDDLIQRLGMLVGMKHYNKLALFLDLPAKFVTELNFLQNPIANLS